MGRESLTRDGVWDEAKVGPAERNVAGFIRPEEEEVEDEPNAFFGGVLDHEWRPSQ